MPITHRPILDHLCDHILECAVPPNKKAVDYGNSCFFAVIGVVIWFFMRSPKCSMCQGTMASSDCHTIPGFDGISEPMRPLAAHRHKKACPKCKSIVDVYIDRNYHAKNRAENFQVWSENYKGKVAVVPGSEQSLVNSDRMREKVNAQNQLIITSAYLYPECNAITELSFSKHTGEDGNYKFTEWRASGIPCVVTTGMGR